MKSFFQKKIDEFLHYLQMRGYSPNSIRTYQLNLNEALKFIDIQKSEDQKYIINLTPYRVKLITKHKKTIYKKISIIKSFVTYLKDNSIKIELLADESIKLPKTLPKPIPFAYIKEILSKIEQEDKIIILLLYSLGLRICELSNLKKTDIQNDWIYVKGKGNKVRQIPLLPQIKNEVLNYLNDNYKKVYIFEKNNKKLNENQLRYRVNKIFKEIGLKVTPHQLRHSFATDLLNSGARITDVSQLLGHNSLESTQIYTELSSLVKIKNYQKSHPLCGESNEFL